MLHKMRHGHPFERQGRIGNLHPIYCIHLYIDCINVYDIILLSVKYIPRHIEKTLNEYLKIFPIVIRPTNVPNSAEMNHCQGKSV